MAEKEDVPNKKTKPTSSATSTPNPMFNPQTAAAAFALARPEIVAVPGSDLVTTNLDVARAGRRGLAVAERVEPLHPALAKLEDLDFRTVSNLRCYALAVLHVQGMVEQGGEAQMALLASLLAEAGPLPRAVVQLTLAGSIDLGARATLEAALRRWEGEVCHLAVRDELTDAPSERDLLGLGDAPMIGAVAAELAALAAGPDAGQRAVAAMALRLLHREHLRLGAGA